MADQEDLQQQDHWRALAEQLGLGPEPTPVSTPAASKARGAANVPETASRVNPAAIMKPEPSPPEVSLPRDDKEPPPETRAEEAPLGESDQERPAEDVQASLDRDAEPRLERRPRGGRRRRGRRSSRDRRNVEGEERTQGTADGEAAVEPAEEPPKEHADQPRRSRGRRRDEREIEEERELAAAEEEPEVEEEPAPEAESDELEDDELPPTDWNVPSWTELIDSLYRPDR